jgi:hypothetical protein
MGVSPQGHWEGYATHLPRRQRPLTEDRRAALEALLAKNQLDPYERGQLAALSRDGSALDQERAETKLRPPSTPAAAAPRISDATIEKWVAAIDKALDAEDDRRGW